MLAAVKSGRLTGLYKEDEQVPALRARALGMGWWQLIPPGEDAAVVLDPANPTGGPPLIAFRDGVRSDSARLDPALRRAWASFQRLGTPGVTRCSTSPSGGGVMAEVSSALSIGPVIANIVPGETAELTHAALNGDWKQARDLHHRLYPLCRAAFFETNPIPIKEAMAMMGMLEPEFRLPMCRMADANRERLRGVLKSLGLLKA